MDIFLKAAACVLIAVVISMILSKYGKDFSVLLAISVCVMVVGAAAVYLENIFSFVELLQQKWNLNNELLAILLKCVGIGLLAEIISMICTDSGNSAFGKVIHFLSTAVILYLCIPLFTELLDMVESILGNV